MSWLDDAACRGTMRTEVFYDRDTRIAREVCRACPVLEQCRADADATETPNSTFGFRAGETEDMRLQRRARRGRYRRNPPKAHGNPKAYRAHRDFGEPPCEECAEAWRLYCRTLDARRAERRAS